MIATTTKNILQITHHQRKQISFKTFEGLQHSSCLLSLLNPSLKERRHILIMYLRTLSPSSPSTIPAVLAEKTASKKTKMESSEKTLGKRPSSESESTAGPSQKYSAMAEDNERLLKE